MTICTWILPVSYTHLQLEEQGVAADMEEAAIQASEAGVDIDMMSPAYMLCLEDVYKRQDPETLVRSDSKEPLLAGKVGIFFGPWWCAYTFADTTLSGSCLLYTSCVFSWE